MALPKCKKCGATLSFGKCPKCDKGKGDMKGKANPFAKKK